MIMFDEIQYGALLLMLYCKERVSVKDALITMKTISKMKGELWVEFMI